MKNNKIYYIITILILSPISFIFGVTTFISEAPVWCNYSPFKQLNWCQPEPPCNSNDDNTLECANTLFKGDKYHNPANLKIDTLRDQKPSIYFRVEETMHMKFDSDHDGYPTSKHNNKLQTLPYNLTINILPPFGTDNLIAILCPQTPTELHNLLQNSTTAPKAEQIIRHIDNCQVGGYSFVSKNSTYFKP